MKLWEFIIREPTDLGAFADLLEEEGHPGLGLVQYLIRHKKFPFRDITLAPKIIWYWECCAAIKPSDKTQNKLPSSALLWEGVSQYCSPTEAIWDLINHTLYKTKTRWYDY